MSLNIYDATTKVSKIVEQKYGCSVEFLYLQNLKENEFDTSLDLIQNEEIQKIIQTISRNFGAQFIIAEGNILVPVYVDAEIFGTIIVKEGIHLDPRLFEDLHTFLDTTLKDFIVKKEKLRRIKIEESILKAEKSHDNIVPLFKNQNPSSIYAYEEEPRLNNGEWRGALFLSGGDYSQTRTIALEIHSLLNRNSFLPFTVMEFQSPNLSKVLVDLGKITIFVPEILDLSEKEGLEIVRYVKEFAHREAPFIIISSQRPLKDLEKDSLLHPDLINCLKEFHLEFTTSSNLKNFYSLILAEPDLLERQ